MTSASRNFHRPQAGGRTSQPPPPRLSLAGADCSLVGPTPDAPAAHFSTKVWLSLLVGPLAGGALFAFYIGVITWAQGSGHALDQLQSDFWFIAPITLGFAAQVGLFFYLRNLRAPARGGLALTAGSTGVSGGAMLACCAHHLSDILPIVGVSGAAIFLNDFKTPLALTGIAMNGAGVVYLLVRLRHSSRLVASWQGARAR